MRLLNSGKYYVVKKLKIITGLAVASFLLAPWIVPFFVPWSGVNCRRSEINIKTGQARYSRSLWFVTISQRLTDTRLSLALQGETVDVADIEAWHRVSTTSPGVSHSPHYRFHGALHQSHMLELFPPQQQPEIAKATLTAWQASGDDSQAGSMLQELDKAYKDR